MSIFTSFLIKLGVNNAAVETIGGRLVGSLSALNSSNAGGYMDPNTINGYTYNETDGRWYGYPPRPDYGVCDWFDPASPGTQAELNQARYWREMNNHVEKASPSQGDAGSLSSPSLWELMSRLPGIVDRYREIAPDIWDQLNDYAGLEASALLDNLRATFNLAESQASPIILDLDGDGVVETTAKGQAGVGVNFNLDNSGYAERSGWVGADDGLLVRDLNANGQIDSGAELFGNHTVLANGFHALAELDANRDGVINASDARAVGRVVFGPENGKSDSDIAFTQNSAWSGTLLFGLLGSNQNGRLMGTGTAGQIDALNDVRDVFYAYLSYKAALAATRSNQESHSQPKVDWPILGTTITAYLSGNHSVQSLLDTVKQGATGLGGEVFELIAELTAQDVFHRCTNAANDQHMQEAA
ncbi:MAG: hypothetical protein AB7S86_07805 [Hydrogenophaga sp.]|uniref:hypothetical protein n=1 Tax=Hydrogenophaga sp. TaxID=1904254 RepID=UPI003D10566C